MAATNQPLFDRSYIYGALGRHKNEVGKFIYDGTQSIRKAPFDYTGASLAFSINTWTNGAYEFSRKFLWHDRWNRIKHHLGII